MGRRSYPLRLASLDVVLDLHWLALAAAALGAPLRLSTSPCQIAVTGLLAVVFWSPALSGSRLRVVVDIACQCCPNPRMAGRLRRP